MGNNHSASSSGYRPRKNVHWKSAEPPSPPGKPVAALGEGPEGREGRLRWTPPRHDGGAPLQGYMVECNRLGSPLWVRTNPPLVLGPELILAGLESGFQYRFRVSAQNGVGVSNPSEISDVLTVSSDRSGLLAPVFQEGLQDVESMENDKTEFKVYFDGNPVPTVSWFKDGFEIFSSRRTAILTDYNCSTLIFHQTSLNDEGEIKCALTNRVGHAVSRARLRLQAAPRVRLPRRYEEGLLFDAGETLQLKIAVAGKPVPEIQWKHDGQPIEESDRIQITIADKFSALRIINASRNDRGEYQVNISNAVGEDSASFLVTITAKPDPPRNVKAIRESDRTAILSWEPPDDDGGCQIGNYIIEYYRAGWNVWLKATTERKLTATLSDLIEGSEYRFRVKAESPYGVSEPSTETDTVVIPGKSSNINIMSSIEEPSNNTLDLPEVVPRRKRQSSPRTEEDDKYSLDVSDSVIQRKQRNIETKTKIDDMFENKENRGNNKMGSSEFMLILYPDGEKSDEDKRKSFQLDLEDALSPPVLSLSAPQLGANMCLIQPLRYSVSSTELLHEHAMNRVYQAIALKEAETSKHTKPKLKTLSDIKINSFDMDVSNTMIEERIKKDIEKEKLDETPKNNIYEIQDVKSEDSLNMDKSEENSAFDDDYTTSTVSSGDSEYSDSDSLDENRRRHDFGESNTYHPRNMTPTIPKENIPKIISKPVASLDSNFVPKPILKKRVSNNAEPTVVKEEKVTKSKPLLSKVPLLKRITKSSDKKEMKKNKAEVKTNEEVKLVASNRQQLLAEDYTPKKATIVDDIHMDEGHIVAERYGNIVKEFGANKKQQPILYTNTEDLKKAAAEQAPPEKVVKIVAPKPVKKTAPPKKILKTNTNNNNAQKPNAEIKNIVKPPETVKPKKTISANHSRPVVQTVSLPKNFSELNAEAESNVKHAFNYVFNIFMVVVAAWLYIFKSELLAIPFLALAIYREMQGVLKDRMPTWLTNRTSPK